MKLNFLQFSINYFHPNTLSKIRRSFYYSLPLPRLACAAVPRIKCSCHQSLPSCRPACMRWNWYSLWIFSEFRAMNQVIWIILMAVTVTLTLTTSGGACGFIFKAFGPSVGNLFWQAFWPWSAWLKASSIFWSLTGVWIHFVFDVCWRPLFTAFLPSLTWMYGALMFLFSDRLRDCTTSSLLDVSCGRSHDWCHFEAQCADIPSSYRIVDPNYHGKLTNKDISRMSSEEVS